MRVRVRTLYQHQLIKPSRLRHIIRSNGDVGVSRMVGIAAAATLAPNATATTLSTGTVDGVCISLWRVLGF